MPTVLGAIDKTEREDEWSDWENLQSLAQSVYLNGECYAFAIALHRGLGWPMVGLIMGGVVWHAVVRTPEGNFRDVRGILENDAALGAPFSLLQPYTFRDIDENVLYAKRRIQDLDIERAAAFAEALWPELPWINSAAKRAMAFAEELEALSRKHGLWIHGPFPAALPFLAKEDGKEGGYELQPTPNGSAFTIDRYFAPK